MNADYVLIYSSEPHVAGLGLALVTAIRVVMPKVPTLCTYQIGYLLKVPSRPTGSNLVYAVVEPELIPAGIQDPRWTVVRDNVVELSAVFLYLRQSVGHLLVRRLFLKPPGTSFGTMFLVYACRPAEAPEPLVRDGVDVPSPPQVEHRWADYPDRAAISFLARQHIQSVEVLVVPVYEERSPRTLVEPIEPVSFSLVFIRGEHQSEVARYDEHVVLGQFTTFWPTACGELMYINIAVRVACNINSRSSRHHHPPVILWHT